MGLGEKEWKAFNDRWEEQERKNKVQRAARIKANQIRWANPSNSESAKEDIGDEVTAAEPADIHHVDPTLPTEDTACKPNTYKSANNPLETTTSKAEIILPMKTRMARETVVVSGRIQCFSKHNRSDDQQNTSARNGMVHIQESVEIVPTSTKVSLQCEVLNCNFRTPLLRKSKSRQRWYNHRYSHTVNVPRFNARLQLHGGGEQGGHL